MKTEVIAIKHNIEMSLVKYDEAYSMPNMHYHSQYEILILDSGKCEVEMENETIAVNTGEAILIREGVSHRTKADAKTCGALIHFQIGVLDKAFPQHEVSQMLKCFDTPVITLSRDSISVISKFCKEFDINARENYIILSMVLNLLNSGSVLLHARPHELDTTFPNPTYRKMIEHVDEHYADITSIKDIMDEFNVSESVVFKVFRKERSMTPKQYINKCRIKQACTMLQGSTKSVKTISQLCGFNNETYFMYLFKKAMNCTPTEYRRNLFEMGK